MDKGSILEPKIATPAGLVGLGLAGLSWVMNYWHWEVPDYIPYLVGIGSVGLLVIGLAGLLKAAHEFFWQEAASHSPRVVWMWTLHIRDSVPFRRLLPISDAATWALKQLEGIQSAEIAKMIRMDDTTPESYMASLLKTGGAMPIYGRPDRFSRLRLIDPAEHMNKVFNNDCSKLSGHLDGREFIDVGVLRHDLKRRVQQIRDANR